MWHLVYVDALGNNRDLAVFSGYLAVATCELLRRYGFEASLEWYAKA
jgi:hypothetical protein